MRKIKPLNNPLFFTIGTWLRAVKKKVLIHIGVTPGGTNGDGNGKW